MSIEPSRAASSSICSLDNMLPSAERLAQRRVAECLGKLCTVAYDAGWPAFDRSRVYLYCVERSLKRLSIEITPQTF
jgi:hypothetical protein